MNLKRLIVISSCGLSLAACNSLFYQPDSLKYTLPEQLSKRYEELRIPVGTRGETLHAWHLYTEHKNKKGVILHFHGNAQNMSAHVNFVAWLLHEGYDVFTFDYRGYGQSNGVAQRDNSIEDGLAVLKTIETRLNETPLFIIAQSLGGAVAVAALQERPDTAVTALVLESSFHSYRSLAQSKLGHFFLTWPLQWPLSFLVTDTHSPSGRSTQLNIPTLLIHGTRDPVVPYQEGVELAHTIRKANLSETLFHLEVGRSHTPCFASAQKTKCKRAVLAFLNSAVQPTQPTDGIKKQ